MDRIKLNKQVDAEMQEQSSYSHINEEQRTANKQLPQSVFFDIDTSGFTLSHKHPHIGAFASAPADGFEDHNRHNWKQSEARLLKGVKNTVSLEVDGREIKLPSLPSPKKGVHEKEKHLMKFNSSQQKANSSSIKSAIHQHGMRKSHNEDEDFEDKSHKAAPYASNNSQQHSKLGDSSTTQQNYTTSHKPPAPLPLCNSPQNTEDDGGGRDVALTIEHYQYETDVALRQFLMEQQRQAKLVSAQKQNQTNLAINQLQELRKSNANIKASSRNDKQASSYQSNQQYAHTQQIQARNRNERDELQKGEHGHFEDKSSGNVSHAKKLQQHHPTYHLRASHQVKGCTNNSALRNSHNLNADIQQWTQVKDAKNAFLQKKRIPQARSALLVRNGQYQYNDDDDDSDSENEEEDELEVGYANPYNSTDVVSRMQHKSREVISELRNKVLKLQQKNERRREELNQAILHQQDILSSSFMPNINKDGGSRQQLSQQQLDGVSKQVGGHRSPGKIYHNIPSQMHKNLSSRQSPSFVGLKNSEDHNQMNYMQKEAHIQSHNKKDMQHSIGHAQQFNIDNVDDYSEDNYIVRVDTNNSSTHLLERCSPSAAAAAREQNITQSQVNQFQKLMEGATRNVGGASTGANSQPHHVEVTLRHNESSIKVKYLPDGSGGQNTPLSHQGDNVAKFYLATMDGGSIQLPPILNNHASSTKSNNKQQQSQSYHQLTPSSLGNIHQYRQQKFLQNNGSQYKAPPKNSNSYQALLQPAKQKIKQPKYPHRFQAVVGSNMPGEPSSSRNINVNLVHPSIDSQISNLISVFSAEALQHHSNQQNQTEGGGGGGLASAKYAKASPPKDPYSSSKKRKNQGQMLQGDGSFTGQQQLNAYDQSGGNSMRPISHSSLGIAHKGIIHQGHAQQLLLHQNNNRSDILHGPQYQNIPGEIVLLSQLSQNANPTIISEPAAAAAVSTHEIMSHPSRQSFLDVSVHSRDGGGGGGANRKLHSRLEQSSQAAQQQQLFEHAMISASRRVIIDHGDLMNGEILTKPQQPLPDSYKKSFIDDGGRSSKGTKVKSQKKRQQQQQPPNLDIKYGQPIKLGKKQNVVVVSNALNKQQYLQQEAMAAHLHMLQAQQEQHNIQQAQLQRPSRKSVKSIFDEKIQASHTPNPMNNQEGISLFSGGSRESLANIQAALMLSAIQDSSFSTQQILNSNIPKKVQNRSAKLSLEPLQVHQDSAKKKYDQIQHIQTETLPLPQPAGCC